ncbi:hypothetical protein BGW80DRAFT_1301334 [Lactifluus volemus]|nr:hypothetical protein BGW80DRAFT_1301334 [Lactifluus volemus]
MSEVPSLLGKTGKTVEKHKGKAAAVDMLPRYSEELGAANEMTTSPAKTTMSPLVLALKNEQGPPRRHGMNDPIVVGRGLLWKQQEPLCMRPVN